MQPDLPWNVAGIPSEAREAARAAARREGMSVGEWLTRRILRSFSGDSDNFEANAEAWRAASAQPVFRAAAEAASATTRDTEEMLANVARSESETQNAYRRIEDQMSSVARRLDAAERSQSENSRAMSKAATEINIATREQAQAFDQLGSHVVGLSERLRRVEQQGAHNDMREAVKALHQGLSRLAEQISSTANQSASQISALAGNLETLAGKLTQTRNETENTAHNLDGRIVMLDSRLRGVEQSDGNSAALLKLSDMVDRLTARFSANEAQNAGNFARMEEHVEALDARTQDPGVARRLQSIENALTGIAVRLEHSEQSNTTSNLEDSLHALAARVDAAEKRQRESAAELQAALKENSNRAEAFPAAPMAAPQMAAPPMAAPTMAAPAIQPAMEAPAFDLPPFPDAPPAERYAPLPAFQPVEEAPPPPPFEPAFNAEQIPASPPFTAEASQPETSESFLSAARRAARAAAATQAEPAPASPLGTFSWGTARDDAAEPTEAKKSGTRWILIGGIALIAIAAAITGILLNSGPRQVIQPKVVPLFSKQVQAVQPAPVKPVVMPPVQIASKPVPHAALPKAGLPQASTQQVAAPTQHVDVKLAAPVAATPKQTASVAPADKLTTLANSGNAMAQTLMGLKYLNGDGTAVNEAEAARWFDRAARQGEPIAEYRLGTLYERGRGVPADAKKATLYYAAAAKAGNRKAMHNLAVAFAQGSGVPKDLTQAAQWFSRAANLGLSDSQFNLAVLYERGMGVPQSLLDAYKWYAVAAAHGDTESKARIDALATQISSDDRAAAQRSADTFQPKPLDPAANTPPDISAL